ncbi:hypothetical protein L6452_39376 [Arctium lappa]|uniref:Uncharacterized protein n=1 Tax=Arctium lappa TaxID=4217 RepID=A0ACB8XSC8_ARCLA|nr:hypothetical protein L6452_39376 [Arctium lappa]
MPSRSQSFLVKGRAFRRPFYLDQFFQRQTRIHRVIEKIRPSLHPLFTSYSLPSQIDRSLYLSSLLLDLQYPC